MLKGNGGYFDQKLILLKSFYELLLNVLISTIVRAVESFWEVKGIAIGTKLSGHLFACLFADGH